MSREDLTGLLTELAEEIAGPSLAAPAWAGARRIRRRRATIAAAAAVLVVAASIAIVRLPHGTTVPVGPPTGAPTGTGYVQIDHLPATIPTVVDAAPYWPSTLNPPANAPTLSQEPLSHAILLFQPGSDGPIFVWGEGSINGGSGDGQFHWVRLDISLNDTVDAGGNRASPVDLNAIGPMGESMAFAQTGEYVIVNLRTQTTERTPLPGLNEEVTWLPDGRHLLVNNDTQTWLVGLDHVVGQVGVTGWYVTPLVGAARGLTTMMLPDGEPMVVHRFDDEGRAAVSSFEVVNAPSYRPSYLQPRGWRMGNLIAQAASGQVGNYPGDFVVVVDDRTESVTHVLDLGTGRNKGCCAVLGWTDNETVLIRTDQDGLLRWHLSTGQVTRLIPPAAGTLSVATMGCAYQVTIEGMTSGCVS
jgi:hypothetical protein